MRHLRSHGAGQHGNAGEHGGIHYQVPVFPVTRWGNHGIATVRANGDIYQSLNQLIQGSCLGQQLVLSLQSHITIKFVNGIWNSATLKKPWLIFVHLRSFLIAGGIKKK